MHNYELFKILFGGSGTAVIGIIIRRFFLKKLKTDLSQKQVSGNKSINIQAGHDVEINGGLNGNN